MMGKGKSSRVKFCREDFGMGKEIGVKLLAK